MQASSHAVAVCDVLRRFAASAVKCNYCRPEINQTSDIVITPGPASRGGAGAKNSLFVPNDTQIGPSSASVAIIPLGQTWPVSPPICAR